VWAAAHILVRVWLWWLSRRGQPGARSYSVPYRGPVAPFERLVLGRGPGNEPLQLAAIKPVAPVLPARIDRHATALAFVEQRAVTTWTIHEVLFLRSNMVERSGAEILRQIDKIAITVRLYRIIGVIVEWVNYHHLLYFWLVAREGSLARAGAELRLAQSTISKQIHQFEDALGHALFTKSGRNLVLTDSGRVVFRYAEEIFSLGREMLDTLKDRPVGRPLRVTVGVADVVPKVVAERVLAPALALTGPVRLVCREDKPDRLLANLALHEFDVILTDAPANPAVKVRAFSHLLGESEIAFFGRDDLARKLRPGFPGSLATAPILLPTDNTVLRRSLDQWFDATGLRPNIVGEFEDSALLKVFGLRGAGVFPAPKAVRNDVEEQYKVAFIGTIPTVLERLYAVTVERRIKHPAVVAICETARSVVFGGA
jgi:LysR family transcriptional regulator, transcriptional activator of nhaA